MTDYNGNYYLYANSSRIGACASIDISSFTQPSNFADFVPQTYDSVYLLGYAFQLLSQNTTIFNVNDVFNTIVNDISFDGASGMIDINVEVIGGQLLAFHKDGQHYSVYNYQNNQFHFAGKIAGEDSYFTCSELPLKNVTDCHTLLYNTIDNKPFKFTTTRKFSCIFNGFRIC